MRSQSVGYQNITYDAAGNELTYVASRIYSPRNLLESVTDAGELPMDVHRLEYAYDGRGVRVIGTETQANGTKPKRYYFYNAQLQLLSNTWDDATNVYGVRVRTNALPAVKNDFVWHGSRPTAQLSPLFPTGIHWYFTDHLGTPLIQTDYFGNVIWRAEYEPYGDIWTMRVPPASEESAAPTYEQPLRFPGQESAMRWEGVEERYNIFRWYRAGWGRYTQADPIGFDGGDINLYRYALANPVRFADPLGLRVRICCRPSALGRDHCFIEEERGRKRRSWGLHNQNESDASLYLTNPTPDTELRRDYPSDRGGTCETWREDCDGGVGKCLQQNFERYPVETYSEVSANLGWPFSGRNSNTFVKCLARKCGLSAGRRVTERAPAYHQPCPEGF